MRRFVGLGPLGDFTIQMRNLLVQLDNEKQQYTYQQQQATLARALAQYGAPDPQHLPVIEQTPDVQRAKADETAHRLMTIPGIGPVTAVALTALAPPAQTFRRGRDFAAWVGLTPLQHSTGSKQKLGATSKMGERTLRRLLIIGASAVLRWAARHGAPAGSWIARMLACKPPMLVRVALANKMARIVWALMAKGGTYQAPAVRA